MSWSVGRASVGSGCLRACKYHQWLTTHAILETGAGREINKSRALNARRKHIEEKQIEQKHIGKKTPSKKTNRKKKHIEGKQNEEKNTSQKDTSKENRDIEKTYGLHEADMAETELWAREVGWKEINVLVSKLQQHNCVCD